MENFVTVRMYREETKCQCCGRYIRNVVEIDGVQYGTRCADGFLPRYATLKKGVLTVDLMAEAKKHLGEERALRFWAQPLSVLKSTLERAIERNADTVTGLKFLVAHKEGIAA